ncbi:nucleotide sugar dehydrogenase [Nocardioides dubius]|uniref:Nucleotide sugar dehydrogenase n=1 Tax=Nocardioides dubius TaxID=317019 RepID=A0ABP4E9I1_9ACTN
MTSSTVCVVALGKIGLPLAVQFASSGATVIGADVDQRAVDLVNRGEEPFPGETDLGVKMKAAVEAGLLSATTDTAAAVAKSDAVVVVVPLFVDADGVPDFGWMDSATREIAKGLRPGTLVSYETTLPIGTTRERWAPMLEAGSGLKAGEDFHLVFSPERVLTGRVFADLRKYPKLVGGINASSTAAGVAFYESVLQFDERDDLPRANGVWDLGTSEASEFAKLAETTYRDVNIGLANQFARYADKVDVDVQLVIEACNSQPYSHIHQPGIAVGGHCIPIYPRMYLWNDPEATVVRAAREANAEMPSYAVDLLQAAHGDLAGLAVLVLGAAYRGGVKETAFSGVFGTVAALEARGATAYVSDPMYTDAELEAHKLNPHRGEPVGAAIIQADHAEYRSLTPADLPGVKVLVDGRRVTDATAWQADGVRRVVIGG